jgi:phytoene desaturase (3,4-didehydrolycopene-forming)
MTNKCKRKAIVVLLSWCVSVSDCFALTQIKRQTLARLACNNSSKTPPPTVTIVGGGVGGLAIACRVKHAQPTARVVILEKNSHVGGRCGSFHVATNDGTFRHERGPSLLLLPHVYQELFVECGSTSEQHGLVMQPCVPAYQVVFDDGDRIDLGFPVSNDKRLDVAREASRQKMNELEMNGANKWDEYMAACQAFLDCGLPNFIDQRFDLLSLPAFVWQSLRRFAKAWPLKPHSDVLDAFFDSDKIKAMASFQDLYVGLEPYRNNKLLGGGIFQTTAPAVFGLLAAIELHPTNKKCGVFAPIGGFESVTKSLVSLATSLGVEMVLNRTVTKIIDDGVTTCHTNESTTVSQFHPSDVVIVNADLPYATACLLNQESNHDKPRYDWSPKRGALNYSFSSGVIAFHWSLNKSLTDLNTNNVFLAAKSRDDAEQSWNRDQHAACTLPFNFYVHRASKTDPTAAPKVSFSLSTLVYASNQKYSEYLPFVSI